MRSPSSSQNTSPEGAATIPQRMPVGLLLTALYERAVRPDNTNTFESAVLQFPQSRRASLARCELKVHVYPNRLLAVTRGNCLVARFDAQGREVPSRNGGGV